MVNITAMADRANGARQRRKLWSRFVRVVAMVVVFCTTYALILPAITMESKAICGQTEHTHTAECYETVEPAECTLVESEGHTHSEACYTYDRQLACALEEGEDHTHGDDCYNVVSTLVCTEPESEGHSHADDATEPEMVLTCALEEHVHTAECYPETEPTEESTDETTLPAGNPNADLETAEDWEKSLNAVELTGKWHEDVLAVAQSQLGYQESTANYELTEDGAVKGITRYGQWYGDPYGDWCAMFVSFCVRYAEIPEEAFPIQANCVKWIETLDDEDAEKDMFRTPEEYTAVPGDLIFFDFEHDGTSDHIGLVVELIDATEDTPAQIKVIEGNSNNRVQYVTYDLDSEDIVGYGVLPTEPAKTYSYSDDDVQVDVVLPADSTVPADAVLKVTPIEEKDDGYDDLVQQAEDTVDGAVNKIKLYDISFYTEDQEYIPVDDRAQVSMRFVEAVVDTAADVAVLHYDENDAAPTVLEEVSVEEQAVDAEAVDAETVVTFETDGFSIFAVVELTTTYQAPSTAKITDGKNYIIAAVNFWNNAISQSLPVMTANVIDGNKLECRSTENNVAYDEDNNVVAITLNVTSNALWTFEKAGDYENAYYIKNTDTQKYLNIGTGGLTVSGEQQAIVAENATGFSGSDTHNAICLRAADGQYYVNSYGNGSTSNFCSYQSNAGERGNHLVLIESKQVNMPVVARNSLNNLNGKKIVISNVQGYAITGTARNTNDEDEYNDRLQAGAIAIADNQSTVSIANEKISNLVWEFEAVQGENQQYYIKSLSTGKYLNIYTGDNDSNNKPLTLSDQGQPIKVEATDVNDSNTVWIHFAELSYRDDDNGNNDNDYNAIDLYSPDAGFGAWNKGNVDQGSKNNQFLLSEYTSEIVTVPTSVSELNGKTMVITVPDYDAVLTNNSFEDGDNDKLAAYKVTNSNGVFGVSSNTNMADISWKFISASDTDSSQYYIQDSTGKYLNVVPTSGEYTRVYLSDEEKTLITVYDNGDGTFVFCITVDGKEYLLDYSASKVAFGAWGRAHDHDSVQANNKLMLTEVEEFDPVVTNLNGRTLALITIFDANPKVEGVADYTPKYAITSVPEDTNGLHGVEVELNDKDGKIYNFDAPTSEEESYIAGSELWTFEAVANKPGVYYIKASNGQYLNLGDGTAFVSENPQEITVLSDTVVGNDNITYEVVYLRANVNGVDVYLRRGFNGYDKKIYADDVCDNDWVSQRRIVLAQPNTIKIDVEKTGLNLNTDDWLFKPHFVVDDEDKDWSITKKEETVVDGGKLPASGEIGAEPVENTRNGTTGIQHFVSFCFQESWDAYTAGKGRDFPQAYMESWAPDVDNLDGQDDGYIDRSKINKEDFIAELKENVYDPEDFQGESPYWGVEYELTHYEVILPDGSTMKDNSGNVVKFAPGTSYQISDDNGSVVISDVNGNEFVVPYGSTFKAQYREFSDILTFYINLYGMVRDTAGDIQPRYIEDFTLGLTIAHIYYPGQYAGGEDDYDNTDATIDSLFKGAYGENVAEGQMHAVIDGFITRDLPEYRGNDNLNSDNQQIQRYLSNRMTPALGASATALADHVLDYIRTVPDIDILLKRYLAGNGEVTPSLNSSTIDTASFDVRWYVVKDQGDSWHIDGVTVGKTEPIVVTKTFYGLEEDDVKGRVNYERTEVNSETHYADTENYQIAVSMFDGTNYKSYYSMQPYDQPDLDKNFTYNDNGDKTCKDPNLNPVIDMLYSYNGGSNPYSWTVSAILGQSYKLDEQNYEFQYKDENGDPQNYDRVSKVKVNNKDGTSVESNGVSATITGGTTGSVEYKNYYTKDNTGMFIVKKLSSVTGLPLAGAEFGLYDANATFESEFGKLLFTEITDADGEVSFYNLNPGLYFLRELSAPDGFVRVDPETGEVCPDTVDLKDAPLWKIKVESDGKVYSYNYERDSFDDLLYPVFGYGVTSFNPLVIDNKPATNTLKVIKHFVGIAPDQVATLVKDYNIVMQPEEDGNPSYTLKLVDSNDYTLVVSPDGLTYTWTLTNVPEIGYTVTESNFKLKNYVTTVSVEGFKDGDYTTYVTSPVVVNNTATFNATFNEEHEDGFTITNSYASDFSMQITKVDSTDPTKTLSGVTFNVYGDHYIATSPDNVKVGDQTLYYLGTVITGADGMATFSGWYDANNVYHKLQLGYAYALEEINAPEGYNRINEPIYLGVIESNGVTDLEDQRNIVFSNGVLSITVENMPGYELPESGGMGTLLYTMGGMFTMAAPVVYGFSKRRRRERRAD